MPPQLIFLGHSANTQRLIDLAAKQYDILGIVDDNYFNNTKNLDGLPIIGSEKAITHVLNQYPDACFFVNSPLRISTDWSCLNPRRIQFVETIKNHQLKLINLIHPTAVVPSTTKLGLGIYIGPYTVLQNHVTIEDNAFIKEQVCIAHHSVIKTNANLSSQCYIGAGVTIGKNVFIGIKGAVIATKNHLIVGDNSITHPGVIVMKNLPDDSVVTVGGKIRGSVDTVVVV
jgi:UDP-3-O-[3-hydroxymyristoyl] glucosamine N-acyltransferase